MHRLVPNRAGCALLAVAVTSALFRLHHVGEDFWLFADQFDHWGIASRSFAQLPMHGTPRMDGGWSYGPIYYWMLWALFHGSAWLAHPLPHYGGAGLGVLHVCAELVLFGSMLRAGMKLPWALLASLLVASAPTEASLSHTLWNPNLSATFFMLALAALLRGAHAPSRMSMLCCVASCVLAVHCHTPCLFFAAPVAAAAVWARVRAAPQCMWTDAAAVLALVAVLQIPYLLSMPQGTRPPSMDAALATPWQTLCNLHAWRATAFVARAVALLVLLPLPTAGCVAVTLLAMAGLSRPAWRAEPVALALLGGMGLTAFGWALYPKDDLQMYWLCATMPGFALALSVGLCWGAQRLLAAATVHRVAWGLVACVLLALPARLVASSEMDRLPAYRRLVDMACTAAVAGKPPVPQGDEQHRYAQQLNLLYGWCGGK